MERLLLECGHEQPVPVGKSAVWCPACNELALVVRTEIPGRIAR